MAGDEIACPTGIAKTNKAMTGQEARPTVGRRKESGCPTQI